MSAWRGWPTAARGVVLALGATVVAAAQAATIHVVSDSREVRSSGSATTTSVTMYFDGRDPVTVVEQELKAANPQSHSGFGAWSAADGLALRTSGAIADGQGWQTSRFDANGLWFAGVADIAASGSQSFMSDGESQTEILGTAGGSASSVVNWVFDLAATTPMVLAMDSRQGGNRGGWNFSLSGDNGFLWDDTFLVDDQGNQLFVWERWLNLAPGRYTLSASLGASAFAGGDMFRADRAAAEFSLTAAPVPEPGTALLVLAGLYLLAAARRRA